MTRLRFLMGFAAIVIAFAVFAIMSKPHDAIPGLRPYVTSETDRFAIQTRPGLPKMPIYEQTLVVHDLTENALREIFSQSTHEGSEGYSASLEASPDLFKMLSHPHAPMHLPLMTDARVTKVVVWHGLTWNEILYARMTHLGSNPFK